jgi:hypothetical protein
VLYLVHAEQRAELVDGFYPIQHLVYDWVRLALCTRREDVSEAARRLTAHHAAAARA